MKAGMAITTTQAPSVNFETRNTMVAMAVTTAPKPLMRHAAANPVAGCATSAPPGRSARA